MKLDLHVKNHNDPSLAVGDIADLGIMPTDWLSSSLRHVHPQWKSKFALVLN